MRNAKIRSIFLHSFPHHYTMELIDISNSQMSSLSYITSWFFTTFTVIDSINLHQSSNPLGSLPTKYKLNTYCSTILGSLKFSQWKWISYKPETSLTSTLCPHYNQTSIQTYSATTWQLGISNCQHETTQSSLTNNINNYLIYELKVLNSKDEKLRYWTQPTLNCTDHTCCCNLHWTIWQWLLHPSGTVNFLDHIINGKKEVLNHLITITYLHWDSDLDILHSHWKSMEPCPAHNADQFSFMGTTSTTISPFD